MPLTPSRDVSTFLKTSQQKAVSTGLLTLALVTALLWGSFRPTVATIIETSRKYDEKKSALTIIRKQNANLTNLVQQRADNEKILTGLDYYFPYDSDFSLFVTNLHEISGSYGLTMESVSFSENYIRQIERVDALNFENMTPLMFQVSLSGSTTRLAAFLSYIESTPFLPKVISVNYTPNKATLEKTSISVTLLVYKMTSPAIPHEQF